MDAATIQALVISSTNLLQTYLPIFASKIAEKAGEELPSTVNNLWQAIRSRFARKPSAQETLIDLLKNPDNSDLQAAFRVQFGKLLEEDEEFAKMVKELTENIRKETTYTSTQHGNRNISIQGKDNIFTQNQSGGITAHNVVINNISTNPSPMLTSKEVYTNQFREGKYYSRIQLSLITPHPVGNLYIGARAQTIKDMELIPMQSTMLISGHTGTREGYSFTNIPNAYGNYLLEIITSKPEKFLIEYNID